MASRHGSHSLLIVLPVILGALMTQLLRVHILASAKTQDKCMQSITPETRETVIDSTLATEASLKLPWALLAKQS